MSPDPIQCAQGQTLSMADRLLCVKKSRVRWGIWHVLRVCILSCEVGRDGGGLRWSAGEEFPQTPSIVCSPRGLVCVCLDTGGPWQVCFNWNCLCGFLNPPKWKEPRFPRSSTNNNKLIIDSSPFWIHFNCVFNSISCLHSIFLFNVQTEHAHSSIAAGVETKVAQFNKYLLSFPQMGIVKDHDTVSSNRNCQNN